jgi:transcriptional regulator with XRE-family HTH domain
MSATPSSAAPLAARIRQERLRLGWTQADLASRAGIVADTYMRFERSAEITLGRLLKVSSALGLNLAFTEADSAEAPRPDPRLQRTRQRGLRRPRPAPTTATLSAASGSASPARRAVARSSAKQTPPAVDPRAVADVMKRYRDSILRLVRLIVSNQLTNYTTRTVLQNVMSSNGVEDATKPAFVGAVETELANLTAENCAALSLTRSEYETWAKSWDPSIGIFEALK